MPDALPVRPPCRLGVRVTFNGIVYDRPCRRPEHDPAEDCEIVLRGRGMPTT